MSEASESALAKLIKYIGPNGLHPGLQFLRDVQYFNPETSLQVTEKCNISIPRYDSIPIGEQVLYRDLAIEFHFSPVPDDVNRVEHLQRKYVKLEICGQQCGNAPEALFPGLILWVCN